MRRGETSERAEAQKTTETASTGATTAVPETVTAVVAEQKQAVVTETPETKPDSNIETWWSSTARKHMIALILSNGTQAVAKFEDYRLILDKATEEGKLMSEALRRCGRYGRDVFVVGENAPGHMADSVQKQDMFRKLRLAAYSEDGEVDPNGLAMLKALFTNKELIDNGIDPSTRDADRLILLALEKKCIGDK